LIFFVSFVSLWLKKMEINGTTVMITGAARIGRTVALWLARQGAANFLLTYNRSKSVIEETVASLAEQGAQALAEPMNATLESDVRRTVAGAIDLFGKIDILINMASMYQPRPIDTIRIEDWRADIDSSATSTLLCMTAVAPEMYRQGNGRIINFTDWTAASRRVNYPSYATYYAAKHAVIGLTEAFALEYAPNVLINCIAPGPILPPEDLTPEDKAQVKAVTPLGRWGGAEEIAEAVGLFVRTNFITGECLRVDGGRHLI
jgi:NAD(P)-dependent dehydrogenase (short-subunit alcohol dehydrogenase family)